MDTVLRHRRNNTMTSVRMPDGSVQVHYTLCQDHLAERLRQGSIAIQDGVRVTFLPCEDCTVPVEPS